MLRDYVHEHLFLCIFPQAQNRFLPLLGGLQRFCLKRKKDGNHFVIFRKDVYCRSSSRLHTKNEQQMNCE